MPDEFVGGGNGGSLSSLKGNVLVGLGDSITANDNQASGTLPNAVVRSRSFLMHAAMMSGGRIVYGGVKAVSGYTTADAITTLQADGKTLLQEVVAAAPAACVVLLGTNDNGALTMAQTIANLTTVYTTLANNSIRPICCTIPPRTGDAAASKNITSKINLWIARYARDHGYALADFFGVLVNASTGDYDTNLNADNVHPNRNGAKAMGQVLATAAVPGSPQVTPYLSQFNADTLVGLLSGNTLHATIVSGVAAGWVNTAGAGGVYTAAADLVTPNYLLGNYQALARASQDVTAGQTTPMTVAGGDRLYIAYGLAAEVENADGIANSHGTIDVRFINGDSTQELFSIRAWDKDIPVGTVLAQEVVVPAGLSSYSFQLQMTLSTTAGSKGRIWQPTVLNLTSLGVV